MTHKKVGLPAFKDNLRNQLDDLENLPGSEILKKEFKGKLLRDVLASPEYQNLKKEYRESDEGKIRNKLRIGKEYKNFGGKIKEIGAIVNCFGQKFVEIITDKIGFFYVNIDTLEPLKIGDSNHLVFLIGRGKMLGDKHFTEIYLDNFNTNVRVNNKTQKILQAKITENEKVIIRRIYDNKMEIGGKTFTGVATDLHEQIFINDDTLEALKVKVPDSFAKDKYGNSNVVKRLGETREIGGKEFIETESGVYDKAFLNVETFEIAQVKGTDYFIRSIGLRQRIGGKEFTRVCIVDKNKSRNVKKQRIRINSETMEKATKMESISLNAKYLFS